MAKTMDCCIEALTSNGCDDVEKGMRLISMRSEENM